MGRPEQARKLANRADCLLGLWQYLKDRDKQMLLGLVARVTDPAKSGQAVAPPGGLDSET